MGMVLGRWAGRRAADRNDALALDQPLPSLNASIVDGRRTSNMRNIAANIIMTWKGVGFFKSRVLMVVPIELDRFRAK